MGKLETRLNNVKIFTLYLLKNVNLPLDYLTIGEMLMRTDYVMYLDFAEAFPQLTDNGLIEEVGKNEQGDPLYAVTRRGCLVAEELKSDLFQSVLDKSLACALQYLDFRKRGVSVMCSSERQGHHRQRHGHPEGKGQDSPAGNRQHRLRLPRATDERAFSRTPGNCLSGADRPDDGTGGLSL